MSAQENKRINRMYHELDPGTFDEILSPDFVGYHSDGSTWDLAQHKQFWSGEAKDLKDTIRVQVAEGDWVATWFTRAGVYQGKSVSLVMMSFKRFENGKVVENWEQYDTKLMEQ
jgi:hypothetical protein